MWLWAKKITKISNAQGGNSKPGVQAQPATTYYCDFEVFSASSGILMAIIILSAWLYVRRVNKKMQNLQDFSVTNI